MLDQFYRSYEKNVFTLIIILILSILIIISIVSQQLSLVIIPHRLKEYAK